MGGCLWINVGGWKAMDGDRWMALVTIMNGGWWITTNGRQRCDEHNVVA